MVKLGACWGTALPSKNCPFWLWPVPQLVVLAVLAKESPSQSSVLSQQRLISWGSSLGGDTEPQQGSFIWVWTLQPRWSASLLKPACLVGPLYLLQFPPYDSHSSATRCSCLFWKKHSGKLYKLWLKGVEISWHKVVCPCQEIELIFPSAADQTSGFKTLSVNKKIDMLLTLLMFAAVPHQILEWS